MEKWRNELNKNAMSGSELMMTELHKHVDETLLDNFQIILSRPELHELDETKFRILWCHDLPEDPQVANFLKDGSWSRFHQFVFVSVWQCQRFIERYNIPWGRCMVLRNAIDPIEVDMEKKWDFTDPDKEIRMVYHTTPHRGLHLLVPAFEHLVSQYKNIKLDVFSSFEIYGWKQQDERFKELFDRIEAHDAMTYHGTVPNEDVRKFLAETAHIFAYPNIWPETSCRSLIESMSSGLMCLHPNYGALFETSGQFTFMYHYSEDQQTHAGLIHQAMMNSIDLIRENDPALLSKLVGQQIYANVNYSWDVRAKEWEGFLQNIVASNPSKEIEYKQPGQTFSYQVDY